VARATLLNAENDRRSNFVYIVLDGVGLERDKESASRGTHRGGFGHMQLAEPALQARQWFWNLLNLVPRLFGGIVKTSPKSQDAERYFSTVPSGRRSGGDSKLWPRAAPGRYLVWHRHHHHVVNPDCITWGRSRQLT